MVATPVAAGLAEASPAQTKMAAREATAVVAVVQFFTERLAMVAEAAAAVWVAMGRKACSARMAVMVVWVALAARPPGVLRAMVE